MTIGDALGAPAMSQHYGRWERGGAAFLDTIRFYSISAAYSTYRKQKATATVALRIRRSSDNTEQDIGFTADGFVSTAAITSFCGAGSGYIRTWYDQSGNGFHLTQTTTSAQPRVCNAGVLDTIGTSKLAPLWDGTDDYLSRGDAFGLTGSPAITVGFSGKVTSGSSGIVWGMGYNVPGSTTDKIFYGITGDASDSPSGAVVGNGGGAYREFSSYGNPGTTHYAVANRNVNGTPSTYVLYRDGTALAQKSLGSTPIQALGLVNSCAVLGTHPITTGGFASSFCAMQCNAWFVFSPTSSALAGTELALLHAELADHCS